MYWQTRISELLSPRMESHIPGAENAHEIRLTPWNNDPVTDSSGEAIYIRDEESGHFWSPAPFSRQRIQTFIPAVMDSDIVFLNIQKMVSFQNYGFMLLLMHQ